jgi:hypothetical protein
MRQRVGTSRKQRASLVMATLLIGGLFVAVWSMGLTSRASATVEMRREMHSGGFVTHAGVARASTENAAYLPLLARNYPLPPPIFGTEMKSISSQNAGLADDAGVNWLRFSAFDWDRIQPTNTSAYDWQVVDEESLENAAAESLQIIATIKYTPEWAQKVNGSFCGPIKEDALDEYAQFLTELVKRYSQAPYNIQHWELGNEPDVDPALVTSRHIFGCWGDENDPYYGGGYYAEMLKVAYPAIKAADPRAQVLIGGLLLDCDPTHPPQGKDCKPARFLEGILSNGGGDYFDIVSFHGYPLYDGSLQWDEGFPSWEARGGVVLGKIDFLREVMSAHGVDKPLMHTEGALLCHHNSPMCNPPQPEFYQHQADYVVWLFIRNWAQGLHASIWYQFEGPGWRHGGLLDENQQPKPAYDALEFLSQELDAAKYEKAVTAYPSLQAHEFSAPGKRIWVLWAPDEQPHLITLPASANKVYDKYGMPLPLVVENITVQSPIYVELTP